MPHQELFAPLYAGGLLGREAGRTNDRAEFRPLSSCVPVRELERMNILAEPCTYQAQKYDGCSPDSVDGEPHGCCSDDASSLNKENLSPSIASRAYTFAEIAYRDPEAGLSSVDHRLRMLNSSLEAVEARCEIFSARAEDAEQKAAWYAQRMAEHESVEDELRAEISRLRGIIDAQKLASSVAEDTLRSMLLQERHRAERLAQERDAALDSRADAVIELGETAEDMEAMQTMLAGCAAYCTELESRIQEMAHASEGPAAFNVNCVKQAIQEAVVALKHMPEAARKKEIHKLLLRWHPDKNPVLKEFASEVTKLINEAASQLQEEVACSSEEP